MANKRPKPEEIVSKLRQVEVLMGQGTPRINAIRQIAVTKQTYYRWRKKYGGMGAEQLKELKRLQKQNEHLRRAVSDLTLDKLILTEAARGVNAALETVRWTVSGRAECAWCWASIDPRNGGFQKGVLTKSVCWRI